MPHCREQVQLSAYPNHIGENIKDLDYFMSTHVKGEHCVSTPHKREVLLQDQTLTLGDLKHSMSCSSSVVAVLQVLLEDCIYCQHTLPQAMEALLPSRIR